MKRKIHFDLTIGSHWPEISEPIEHMHQVRFPEGGYSSERVVEFDDVDGEEPFVTACNVLKEQMGSESYHIWYWTWMDSK